MRKSLQFFYLLIVSCVLLVNCRKKEWDAYYGRPASLEPPIYQQLATRGNFTNLLACIDKAGYKNTLSAAGYWTFFAPTDSAFQVYFKANNVSSIDQLDSTACRKIVTYCLVYNAFKLERLGDGQSNTGWTTGTAFKRRTAYYTGVYDGTDTAGHPIKVIASNRNNNGTTYWVEADNNNKYIPYFVPGFMTAKGLTAADYNYFYPTSTYTGFNVVDAAVTEKDIPAENGVIHIINKVITALPSIDQYLAGHPEYSEFRNLFDKFLIQYALNATVTTNYNNVHGGNASIYTKVYNSSLAYSPNIENFLKTQDNDGQWNSYSLFVPTNTALLNYINTVLLEHYNKISDLPIGIIYDFVNAHMFQTAVWPTKFSTTYNVQGEEARFDPANDIVDKQILSNGMFYGTNKVQEANVFSSVYGKAYLDPNYSMMTSLLNQELKYVISNVKQKYTLFLVSNSVLNAAGYFADPTVDNNVNYQWRYTPPGGGTSITGSSALVRLLRVLNLHVVPGVDLTSTAGSGVLATYGGEFIRYNGNTVYAAGNVDSGNVAHVTATKTAKNGTVHYIDRILNYSEAPVSTHLAKLGGTSAATSQFYNFWQYFKNWGGYTAATGDIVNVSSGVFYTFFIPNNAAIVQAVNDGLLPGTGTAPNKLPNFNPTDPAEKFQVEKFIYYHILNKKSVATNGMESGTYETLFKTNAGDATTIFVNNNVVNVMTLTDMNSRTANVILNSSNYLSNRCVFHLTDNYLKYTE
jgi:uncharacterized surface protein with fasciclin (FAS1) repeats